MSITYENLLAEAETSNIEVYENNRIGKLHGLCIDNIITINSELETNIEKTCILAEELGALSYILWEHFRPIRSGKQKAGT